MLNPTEIERNSYLRHYDDYVLCVKLISFVNIHQASSKYYMNNAIMQVITQHYFMMT